MTREDYEKEISKCDLEDNVSEAFYIFEIASQDYIRSLEQQNAKLQYENEHLKRMVEAFKKENK